MQENVCFDFMGHHITTKKNEAIEYIDKHIKSYILYEGDMKSEIQKAIENDPNCVIAYIMAASFFLSRYDFEKADSYLKEASKHMDVANDREKLLYEATKLWRKGDVENALKLHIECLEKFPKDLWNAKKTQLHAFNNGKKDQLLKVSTIVYDACRNEVELIQYAYGMHLFALQENKFYQDAIDLQKERLITFNKESMDSWSVHAICHSLHGLGLIDEGINWMEKWCDSWENLSNFMYTHNWWHLSFLYLEKGYHQKTLDVYDKKLMSRENKNISVLVNALGILMRMEVRDVETGNRVFDVLSFVENKKNWHYDPFYDLFVVFCLAKSNKKPAVEKFFKSLEDRITKMNQYLTYKDNCNFFNCFCVKTWNCVIKPMAKAVVHYFQNEYEECFEYLDEIFANESYFNINASNEQIEVFIELFIDCLINLGNKKRAREMVEKQVSGMKEVTSYYKSLLERLGVNNNDNINLSNSSNEGGGVDINETKDKDVDK